MSSTEKSSSQDTLPAPPPPAKDAIMATCHCGRTQVEVPSKPTRINECQCTVCYKYGAMWAYYIRRDVAVTSSAGTQLDRYVRTDDDADGNISFNRCGHCGCLTHWWGENEYGGDEKKMGVNCRMMPVDAIEGVEKIQHMKQKTTKSG